jgi:hypothetical protein
MWKLIHTIEDKAGNGDRVVYDRQTVGEWSDEQVEQAVRKIQTAKEITSEREHLSWFIAYLREFLPDPIKEVL